MSTKIAIMGDEHLGNKQYGLEERELDFRRVFIAVVQHCIDAKVRALVIPGDLYNMARPSGELVFFVKSMVRKLRDSLIQVFGISGNHDVGCDYWLQLTDIVPLNNTCKEAGIVGVVGSMGVSLSGLNWTRPNMFYSELAKLVAYLRSVNVKHVDYFVFHQLFDEFIPYQTGLITATGTMGIIREFTPKAVICGDLHESVQMEFNGVPFIYTGSTELNKMNEPEAKYLIILDDKKVTRIPLVTRPFIRKYIQTEQDLDGLLATYPRETDKMPMLLLEYDNEAKELAKRAGTVLKENNALFRLLPIVNANSKSILAQLTHDADVSRSGTIGYLKKAVESCFDTKSDEYQLIFQLLSSPDDLYDIIMNYAKTKNL